MRERNKQRRRAAILDAARELLREGGEGATTVDRIAERAQVAPGTVFNLVGTRERLWAALADEGLARLDLEALPNGPLERAHAIVAMVLAAILGDASVYRVLVAHWIDSGRLLREDPTHELVACLRATGADLDHERLGRMISTACIGAMHRWAAELIDDAGLAAACADAVDLAFAAAGDTRALGSLRRPC